MFEGRLSNNRLRDRTVVDDPTMRGGYGCYPVDDEGEDKPKNLIVNGVLTEYLNHRETAQVRFYPNEREHKMDCTILSLECPIL